MDMGLAGKTVIITGAARGIGAATARAMASEGARVAVVDRDAAAAQALASSLSGAWAVCGDLSDPAVCERVIADVVGRWGSLDVLVNNAGVNDSVSLEHGPDDFMASLRRNLLHVFALAHHARAHLVRARGAIVNVSSKVAETGQGQTSGYAAAKGAVNALTREWAVALAPHGVRVNTVVPAECDTDQYQRWFASQPDPAASRAAIEHLVPLGRRLTRPEEVADMIVFLASPRAAHVTGELVHVDGGYTRLDRAASAGHAKWGATTQGSNVAV